MQHSPYAAAVVFADGAPDAGLGHLYRSRNLAKALRSEIPVTFAVDQAPAGFLGILEQDGIAWHRRDAADDAIERQIVIFDGYRFAGGDFSAARSRGNLVIVIDDRAEGYFDCDLVISHGPQNKVADYRAAKDCRFLLGAGYALVNPCFYGRSYRFRPEVRRLFLGFGGSDPGNLTEFALSALIDCGLDIEVTTGGGYQHIEGLRRFAGGHVHLHHDLTQPDLASLMAECDAAVASGGTISLELLAVTLPALLVAFAENHRRPCMAFEEQGLAVFGGIIPDQGPDAFRRSVDDFVAATTRREAVHKRAGHVFRESGVERVAGEIARLAAARRPTQESGAKTPNVALHPLAPAHLEQTRQWITDPRVADPFLFAGQVTAESHRAWFAGVGADRTQCIFAIHDSHGAHVGNVGFKNIDREARRGEMWIYTGPHAQGHGFGSAAVRAAVAIGFDQLRLTQIYLHVSADNHAARRIYEKAGFRLAEQAAQVLRFKGRTVPLDRMECGEADYTAANRQPAVTRGPRVALMQPMFLPWLGYFELMDAVDVFVLLDDFQFSRQGWGHRNRLFLSPGRAGIVSLPIRHPDNLAATFLDITPAGDRRWHEKLARSLRQSYGRSPFFAEVWDMIGPPLAATTGNLADFELVIIQVMARRLGIGSKIRRSSEFAVRGLGRSERLLALLDTVGAGSYYAARGSADYMREDGLFPLPRLPVFFQDFDPIAYPQPGSSDFVPRLSALDALFNLSTSEARVAMHSTRRWLPWDEVNSPARIEVETPWLGQAAR